jgi:hypothetical protein
MMLIIVRHSFGWKLHHTIFQGGNDGATAATLATLRFIVTWIFPDVLVSNAHLRCSFDARTSHVVSASPVCLCAWHDIVQHLHGLCFPPSYPPPFFCRGINQLQSDVLRALCLTRLAGLQTYLSSRATLCNPPSQYCPLTCCSSAIL